MARAHDNAVGRRAPHREVARADFAQAQGIVQRQGMRDTGLIELRRHDPDVIGQRAGDLLDNLQAGSMDAVVIGAEDSHPFKMPCSVDSTSGQGAVLSFSCRRGKPGNIEQKGPSAGFWPAAAVIARSASALSTALHD